MKKRTITGAIMALVFIPLIVIPQLFIPFYIVMGAASLIGAHELIKMYEKEKEFSKLTKVMIMMVTLFIYLITSMYTFKIKNIEIGLITNNIGNRFLIGTLISLIISLILLVIDKNYNALDVGKTLFIPFYVGLGASMLVVLRLIGLEFIAYLFLTTVATDVFAYLFGMKFGKHKMAPNISPKKSWEGAIGGTIMAVMIAGSFAAFYGKIFDKQYITIISNLNIIKNVNIEIVLIYLFTICLSITGQLGDLIASKMKRTYDIKDFGYIFPGHGGILDRFDSAFFASIVLMLTIILILM